LTADCRKLKTYNWELDIPLRKLRLAALAAGLALLAWLVVRSGPARLAGDLLKVGWWMVALLMLSAVRNAARSQAVRLALGDERHGFSFARMYAVLLVSGAVQFVSVAGLVIGEATKGWLLGRRVSGPRAVSTVMVDVLLYYLTAALFTLGAMGAFFAVYPALGAVRRAGVAGAALVTGAVLLGLVAFRRRWLGARRIVAPLARCGLVRRRETLERIEEIDAQMFGFRQRHPAAFGGILAFDFAAHFLAALEVTVILWLLGFGARYGTSVVVEGLTKLVETGGLLVPGDVGLYQGGTALIFRALGYAVATGVAVGIIRQLRSILWAAIGFLALLTGVVERDEGHRTNV
jgi:hypothetical protein